MPYTYRSQVLVSAILPVRSSAHIEVGRRFLCALFCHVVTIQNISPVEAGHWDNLPSVLIYFSVTTLTYKTPSSAWLYLTTTTLTMKFFNIAITAVSLGLAGVASAANSFAGSNLYYAAGLSASQRATLLGAMQSAGMKVLRVWLDGQSTASTKVRVFYHITRYNSPYTGWLRTPPSPVCVLVSVLYCPL